MQFACSEQALWVAPLVEVGSLVEMQKKLALEEERFAFAEKEGGFRGLKEFVCLITPPALFPRTKLRGRATSPDREEKRWYIFDNHNHALFFWYQEYLRSGKVCKVVHIDQHSDMWENQFSLPVDLLEVDRRAEVFQFVQRYCTVGNFLQPALKAGLISEVVQVRTADIHPGEKLDLC